MKRGEMRARNRRGERHQSQQQREKHTGNGSDRLKEEELFSQETARYTPCTGTQTVYKPSLIWGHLGLKLAEDEHGLRGSSIAC
jgi:hypothetical protein